MKKTLSSYLIILLVFASLLFSCDQINYQGKQTEKNDQLELAADSFGLSFFNWQYQKAAKWSTEESLKWLKLQASQITQEDVKTFNEQPEGVEVEINSINTTSDTTATVTYEIHNYVVNNILTSSPTVIPDTVYTVNMVKRHGKWLTHLPNGISTDE